jgi:hypothetical protein
MVGTAEAIGRFFSAVAWAEEAAGLNNNNQAVNNNNPPVNNAPVQEAPKAEVQKNEAPKQEAAKAPEANNEFITISYEFVSIDLRNFTEKYPLITTIVMIATGFFALMHIFSFSPVSIVTGLFLGALCISLAKSIWNVHRFSIFSKVWSRAMLAFSSNPTPPVKAAEAAPAQPVQAPVALQPEQKV